MDNINKFSLKRVFSLSKMILLEQPRVFIMLAILLLGVLSLAFIFVNFNLYDYSSHNFESARVLIYIIFVFYGMIFTSLAFGKLKDKKGRTAFLTLPALQIEKYVANFIIYVLLYIVSFVVVIFIADIIRMIVMSVCFHYDVNFEIYPFEFGTLWCEETANMMAIFLIMQSFYWVGAILWPRNSFIKTYSALSILGLFYVIVGTALYHMIIGDHNYHLQKFDDKPLNFNLILWLFVTFIFVVNYIITYVRLKETDVVQKLL